MINTTAFRMCQTRVIFSVEKCLKLKAYYQVMTDVFRFFMKLSKNLLFSCITGSKTTCLCILVSPNAHALCNSEKVHNFGSPEWGDAKTLCIIKFMHYDSMH